MNMASILGQLFKRYNISNGQDLENKENLDKIYWIIKEETIYIFSTQVIFYKPKELYSNLLKTR